MSETSTYNQSGVQIYEAMLEPLLRSFRTTVTTVCQRLNSQHVLDVGCGPAGQGRKLAMTGIACTGLDNAPAMLAAASRQAKATPGNLLTIMHGDATALPFADHSVDTVLLSLIVHQMAAPLRQAALAEALRVGQRVVIAEYRLPERNLDYPGHWIGCGAERLAGPVHYGHYRLFMAQGGIEGLVMRCQRPVQYRETVLMGAASVVALGAGVTA